ncbi:MAG: class I SAM-dependent methyltransferase [Elusimicrobiota bacterium]
MKDTSWDKVARWYDRSLTRGSDLHRDVVTPGALRLLGPKKGERILDVGCGQGFFCNELSRRGAEATGVDASKRLIQTAAQRWKGPRFLVGDAGKLEGSYDALVCILALQNMEPLADLVRSMSRALKSGGRLVWVLNHPCFRIPRQSGWGFDDKRKLQFRRVDRYMSPMKIPIQMHPGAAPSVHTWTFHHPLSGYFGALAACGLAVDALEEWVSERSSQAGPRAGAEDSARSEIPMFLALRARKG